jgi:serine/threonine protein kinase
VSVPWNTYMNILASPPACAAAPSGVSSFLGGVCDEESSRDLGETVVASHSEYGASAHGISMGNGLLGGFGGGSHIPRASPEGSDSQRHTSASSGARPPRSTHASAPVAVVGIAPYRPLPVLTAFDARAGTGAGAFGGPHAPAHAGRSPASRTPACPPTPARTPAWARDSEGKTSRGRAARSDSLTDTKLLMEVPEIGGGSPPHPSPPAAAPETGAGMGRSLTLGDLRAADPSAGAAAPGFGMGVRRSRPEFDGSAAGGGMAVDSSGGGAGGGTVPPRARFRRASDGPLPDSRADGAAQAPWPSATLPPSASPSLVVFERDFRAIRTLGVGSFSKVIECVDRSSGVRYAVKKALKMMRSRRDRDLGLREVRAAVKVGPHPCLVRYRRAWQEAGYLMIQLELCNGGTVRDAVSRLPASLPVPEATVWAFLGNTAAALAHLHAAGWVHLDVKLDNVLVEKSGRLKLGDLGAAGEYRRPAARRSSHSSGGGSSNAMEEGAAAAAGHVSGWWGGDEHNVSTNGSDVSGAGVNFSDAAEDEGDSRYMAPELLSSGAAGRAPPADIFSLGMSLFELTWDCAPPGEGQQWQDIRAGLVPPCPRALGRSPELQAIILACLSPDPAHRPTAAALRDHATCVACLAAPDPLLLAHSLSLAGESLPPTPAELALGYSYDLGRLDAASRAAYTHGIFVMHGLDGAGRPTFAHVQLQPMGSSAGAVPTLQLGGIAPPVGYTLGRAASYRDGPVGADLVDPVHDDEEDESFVELEEPVVPWGGSFDSAPGGGTPAMALGQGGDAGITRIAHATRSRLRTVSTVSSLDELGASGGVPGRSGADGLAFPPATQEPAVVWPPMRAVVSQGGGEGPRGLASSVGLVASPVLGLGGAWGAAAAPSHAGAPAEGAPPRSRLARAIDFSFESSDSGMGGAGGGADDSRSQGARAGMADESANSIDVSMGGPSSPTRGVAMLGLAFLPSWPPAHLAQPFPPAEAPFGPAPSRLACSLVAQANPVLPPASTRKHPRGYDRAEGYGRSLYNASAPAGSFASPLRQGGGVGAGGAGADFSMGTLLGNIPSATPRVARARRRSRVTAAPPPVPAGESSFLFFSQNSAGSLAYSQEEGGIFSPSGAWTEGCGRGRDGGALSSSSMGGSTVPLSQGGISSVSAAGGTSSSAALQAVLSPAPALRPIGTGGGLSRLSPLLPFLVGGDSQPSPGSPIDVETVTPNAKRAHVGPSPLGPTAFAMTEAVWGGGEGDDGMMSVSVSLTTRLGEEGLDEVGCGREGTGDDMSQLSGGMPRPPSPPPPTMGGGPRMHGHGLVTPASTSGRDRDAMDTAGGPGVHVVLRPTPMSIAPAHPPDAPVGPIWAGHGRPALASRALPGPLLLDGEGAAGGMAFTRLPARAWPSAAAVSPALERPTGTPSAAVAMAPQKAGRRRSQDGDGGAGGGEEGGDHFAMPARLVLAPVHGNAGMTRGRESASPDGAFTPANQGIALNALHWAN